MFFNIISKTTIYGTINHMIIKNIDILNLNIHIICHHRTDYCIPVAFKVWVIKGNEKCWKFYLRFKFDFGVMPCRNVNFEQNSGKVLYINWKLTKIYSVWYKAESNNMIKLYLTMCFNEQMNKGFLIMSQMRWFYHYASKSASSLAKEADPRCFSILLNLPRVNREKPLIVTLG